MFDPKPYGLNELREIFLSFFESKGHLRLPSFSLVPQNDASLLLINSGMAPMKPFFTGEQESDLLKGYGIFAHAEGPDGSCQNGQGHNSKDNRSTGTG